MGCRSDDKKKTSCGRKLFRGLIALSVISIAGATAWYFLVFAKDVEMLIGDCGGCHCIPDESTGFECPSANESAIIPSASYPEETHLVAWQSQTILNPYVLNCNPYTDGVFCDTEPPLDPDFKWTSLGETAVCAVHYEEEENTPQRRERARARRLEEELQNRTEFESEIEIDFDGDGENATSADEEDEDDGPNTFTLVYETDTCENKDNAFYRIKTYASREEAELAGGFVTHVGSCGVCSTLQDLAVYANINFIGATSPGNFCQRQAATSFENGLSCYRGLGMTQDCAKLWADTSWNTARNCFGSCVIRATMPQFGGDGDVEDDLDGNVTLSSAESSTESNKWYDLPATLRERFASSKNKTETDPEEDEEKLAKAIPSNGPAPECALNDCITCNDEVSAPIFERFAGRSRRRSGLLSTAARHCSSLPNIVQNPCPDTQPLSV